MGAESSASPAFRHVFASANPSHCRDPARPIVVIPRSPRRRGPLHASPLRAQGWWRPRDLLFLVTRRSANYVAPQLVAQPLRPSPNGACALKRRRKGWGFFLLLSSRATLPRAIGVVGRQKASSAKSHQQDELFAVNKAITALLARHKVASEGSAFPSFPSRHHRRDRKL
jgi:hypothetical protein